MPNTTPDNISYPANTDAQKTVEQRIKDTALSVQGAITSKRISPKSASYSLLAADSNSVLQFTNSTPVVLTIDNVLPVGASVEIVQDGTGQVTFTAGSGVTLSSGAGYGTQFQYGRAYIICVSSGVYRVTGDIRKVITATGGTITDVDGYRIHTFTSSGNFVVSSVAADLVAEYLLVAGGGGGGGGRHGAGAGAGGVIMGTTTLSATTYAVVVGAGGSGGVTNGSTSATSATIGANSTFNGLTAYGGGSGGGHSGPRETGETGGSGGGAGHTGNVFGDAPYGQGYPGSRQYDRSRVGAGGGASGPPQSGFGGESLTYGKSDSGGPGIATQILGRTVYFAGGGGGGGSTTDGYLGGNWSGGDGGIGGGGGGAVSSVGSGYGGKGGLYGLNVGGGGQETQTTGACHGGAGGANTGGGGGGSAGWGAIGNGNGGNGGSGVFIVRYKL